MPTIAGKGRSFLSNLLNQKLNYCLNLFWLTNFHFTHFCRHGCCRVTSSTFRPTFNPLLDAEDIQRKVDQLPPEQRDDELDAYGNTWSELDAMEEAMREHDINALKLPDLQSTYSNATVKMTNFEQSNNTLPRGIQFTQRKLQRKMSDPEMRTNIIGTSIQTEGTMWDTTSLNPKSVITSGTPPAIVRRDSEDSIASGSNIPLATSLNVPSRFLQHSPSHDGLMNKSIDREKWKIEDNIFNHQTIKRNYIQPGYAVINPFDPTQTTKKVTSNRRRWTHIFPKGGLDGSSTGKMQHIDEHGLETSEAKTESGALLSSSMLTNIAGGDIWSGGYDSYNTTISEGRIRRGKLLQIISYLLGQVIFPNFISP